jgi:hypothetical protein
LLLGACSGSAGKQGGGDPTAAGHATCDRFRQISGDAFSEAISAKEAAAGYRDLKDLAADASAEIRRAAEAVAEDANAAGAAAVSGDPNVAADAMADLCNDQFPL